jgi:diguanylate cyclase (GGDEF)-like protein/PAS domain S-box-containing protein
MNRLTSIALLGGTALALAAGIFVLSLALPGISVALLYPVLFLLFLHTPHRMLTLVMAVVTSLLTVLGAFLSPPGAASTATIVNQLLILLAIWVTAAIGTLHQRVQEQHACVAALVNSSADAVIGESMEGRVTSWNPAAKTMFGYTAAEMLGRPSAPLIPSDRRDEARRLMEILAQGERIDRLETIRQKKDGRAIPLVLSLSPMRGMNGKVIGSCMTAHDATVCRAAETQQPDLAYYDFLTGLPNRHLLMKLLDQALVRARRTKKPLAILFIDLDRFKLVNDTLGHPIGDLVLKTIAPRLTGCVRGSDVVARMGGDEFMVILEDLSSASDAGRVAQKILDAVALPCCVEGDHEIFLTASIGIVLYPADSEDRDGLIRYVDIAMYSAKAKSNAFVFYSPAMNIKAGERMRLETDLRRALQRKEFLLHYQPVITSTSKAVSSVEALIRWRHPEQGLLYPATFIPVAEESGLIVPLSEWVLRAACAQARTWQTDGFPGIRMAVNISRRLFQSHNLCEMIVKILHETGLAPSSLEIELTESLFIQDRQKTFAILERLHKLGVRIAIDDFGIEYSSLGYLKHLPITTLKIDQSFVRDIHTKSADAAIAQTIITLARCLNLTVIAEGVETDSQAAFLQSQQCHEMQGYYFSRPMPPELVTSLLEQRGRR